MPVTQEEFEAAARRGLGRAVLWLKQSEVTPNRDFLLHACTHNLAYDRQTEDNRALYMFDIIKATGEPGYYAQAVTQALAEVSEGNDWESDERSIDQMFDLVGFLAKSGDTTARQALYSLFTKFAVHSGGHGADALVDVDGLKGYLFVVSQWILHPQDEEDNWYESFLLGEVERRFGAEETQTFLHHAAQADPVIGTYLAEGRKTRAAEAAQRKQKPEAHKFGYAELRQAIFDADKPFNRPRFWRWGEKMSGDDAEQFARELLMETDPKRLERYLHLFHRRAFPLDHTPLLALAQHPDQAIASTARMALAQLAHPSVRALALELMDTDPQPGELIELLIVNFQPGDEKAIERVLQEIWDPDDLESVGRKMRRVFEKNPTPGAIPSLLLFYERGYCTICRQSAIDLLAKIGPLPPHIIEEGQFDADKETRKMTQEAA